jgi:outer membrane protein TolC
MLRVLSGALCAWLFVSGPASASIVSSPDAPISPPAYRKDAAPTLLARTVDLPTDTVRLSLAQFVELGLATSGQVGYQRYRVDLAENQIDVARSARILPRFSLQTQHGLVPGVVSDSLLPGGAPLPEGQYYLDPFLTNDWTDWAVFTRAQIEAIQPIFTWGAAGKLVRAAEAAADASRYQFASEKDRAELTLATLYFGYQLSREVSRLVEDADGQIAQVERRIKEMVEEGSEELSESDVFKFEIFRSEFAIQRDQAFTGRERMERLWAFATRGLGDGSAAVPEDAYLNASPVMLESFDTYLGSALAMRPELKGVDAGIEAVSHAVDAMKAEAYPNFFLGLSGSYALTPNRPKQDNPFITNTTNYASARFGIGIRQNLNFLAIDADLERGRLDLRRTEQLKLALEEGIVLEVNEAYQKAQDGYSRIEHLEKALVTTKNWVRHEQLNYDYGFGDVKELVDSMKKELELRAELIQATYEWNVRLATLYKAAGIPLTQLMGNP